MRRGGGAQGDQGAADPPALQRAEPVAGDEPAHRVRHHHDAARAFLLVVVLEAVVGIGGQAVCGFGGAHPEVVGEQHHVGGEVTGVGMPSVHDGTGPHLIDQPFVAVYRRPAHQSLRRDQPDRPQTDVRIEPARTQERRGDVPQPRVPHPAGPAPSPMAAPPAHSRRSRAPRTPIADDPSPTPSPARTTSRPGSPGTRPVCRAHRRSRMSSLSGRPCSVGSRLERHRDGGGVFEAPEDSAAQFVAGVRPGP